MSLQRRVLLWLIVPLLCLALITAILVWITQPDATIRFVRFETREGQQHGVFTVQNQSAKVLRLHGFDGVPRAELLIYHPTMGPVSGPAWLGRRKGAGEGYVLIAVGESLDFAIPLRWAVNGATIREPFRIGLLDFSELTATQNLLHRLRLIGGPGLFEEHRLIWSDLVSQ